MRYLVLLFCIIAIIVSCNAQPVIQVTPNELVGESGYGISSQAIITIQNTGNQDLHYNISNPLSHPHLVAYFPFNGDTADFVNPDHFAEVNGATLTNDRFGVTGRAYQFDGVDDYIFLGDYFTGYNWSVSFYATLRQDLEWSRFFDAHHFESNYWMSEPDVCLVDYNARYGFDIDYGNQFHPDLQIELNEAVFITLTIGPNGERSMYKNGVLVAQTGSAGVYHSSNDNTPYWSMFLGTNANVNTYLNGIIDEVMLFDTVLTPEEVLTLYCYMSGPQTGISFQPHEGSVAPDSLQTILLVNSNMYPIGNYHTNIEIHSDDMDQPEVIIPYSYEVLAPEITIDTQQIIFNLNSQSFQASNTIYITNNGPGVLNYNLSVEDSNNNSLNIPEDIPQYVYLGGLNGHKYYRSSFTCDWTEAKNRCEQLGGHLATLSSEEENNIIGGTRAFIGLTDEDSEGIWKWVTGEPVTYTNWSYSEPNNSGGCEDYVEISELYQGRYWWNDCPVYGVYPFPHILEIDGNEYPPRISFSTIYGSIQPGESMPVTVYCDGTQMINGRCDLNLMINTNATNSLRTIPIIVFADHILPQKVLDLLYNDELTDSNQITVNWMLNELADSVLTYKIYRKAKYETNWRMIGSVHGYVSQYSDRAFTPLDTTWVSYRISAVNRLGEGPTSEIIQASLKRFRAPAGLSLQIINNRHVLLTWNPVSQTMANTQGTPTCYIIYKSEHPFPVTDFDFLGIATVNEFTHQWAAYFQPSNRLFYIVTAYGGDISDVRNLITARYSWRYSELSKILNYYNKEVFLDTKPIPAFR